MKRPSSIIAALFVLWPSQAMAQQTAATSRVVNATESTNVSAMADELDPFRSILT
jgi:hypothetical protein